MLFAPLLKRKTQKKLFIKEFNVTKLEPFINENSFSEDNCRKVLLHINDSQYSFKERFPEDFYKHMNVVIEGAYVAGLRDGIESDEGYVENMEKELQMTLKRY